jgi:predicted PurR-regulated permease PerM
MTDEETLTFSRRRIRLLALLAVVGFIVWLARGVLGPFVVAAVLAYAFAPVVSAAEERTRLPRVAVIGLGYVLFLLAVGVVAFLAAERAGSELNDLTSGQQDIVYGALHKLFGDTLVIAGTAYSVQDISKQLHDAILGLVSSPNDAVHLAERAVDIALQAILTLIVTFYFLLDGRRFGQFALRFLEPEQQASARHIGGRVHVVLGHWLRGQLFLIALVAAVLYVILGPILHVPFALALSLLSGVLEIIPLVGPIVAAALAATVAFSTKGSDTTIVVLIVYVVVRQIEDQIVMPIVIGRAVHLHPVITIFAVLVGLSAWGILGGLLAVPVAAALNVTLHELYPEETGRGALADASSGAGRGGWMSRFRGPRPALGRARPSEEPMARRDVAVKRPGPGSSAEPERSARPGPESPAGPERPAGA